MKELIKSKKNLLSNKGELLIETLVSILILAILLGAVSLAIESSMSTIGESIRRSTEMQEGGADMGVNNVVMIDYHDPATPTGIIEFRVGVTVVASHDINTESNQLIAFAPHIP